MLIAEVVPSPGLVPAIIALGALVVFAFAYALAKLAEQFTKTIFSPFLSISIFGRHPFGFLGGLAHSIEHFFGSIAFASERYLARSWHQVAGVFDFIGQMFLLIASLNWLMAREIARVPGLVYHAIAGSPTAKTAKHADARAKRAGAAAAAAGAVAGAGFRARSRTVPSPWRRWVRAQAQQAAWAGAVTGAAVAERTVPALRINDAQRKRLALLEKALGALGLAALVDIGLRKLDLGHLRCRNNRKIGKSLCGLPFSILEGLLGDALDVLLVTQLCRIVTLMTDGAKLAAPALDALVAMVDDLIRCTGSERPKAFPLAVYTPPSTASPLPLH